MANEEKIAAKIKELAPQGKMSCAEARHLAEELEVEPGVIGEICDQLKIKICGCVLGCF